MADQEKTSDPVNHPKHYTSHPSGVECIEITEAMKFCTGNAFKYIFRHKHKGRSIEDLKKSAWYVSKEIERASRELWSTWPVDPRYEVSTLGMVRRADTKIVRKPAPIRSGYMTCMTVKNKKNRLAYVHRMVVETFIGPIPKGMVVAHRDGVKSNNRITNLRIDSPKGNLRDTRFHGTHRFGENNPASSLTMDEANKIKAASGPNSQIAKQFGVSRSAVQRIKSGKSYGDHRTSEQVAFDKWFDNEPESKTRDAAKIIWEYETGTLGLDQLGHAISCINQEIERRKRVLSLASVADGSEQF